MWENETIVMVTSLKKRILQGQHKVRFAKIEQDASLPAIIRDSFRKRIERYIVKETPLVIQPTPHFDLAPETLESLKSRFMDVLRENVLFDANEVEDLLKESLVRRLDYLVKPFDTLRQVLFAGRTEAAGSEMKEAFEPFTGILPYAEKLTAEMNRQAKPSLSVTDYDALIATLASKESEGTGVVLSDFGKLAEFLSETQGETIVRMDGTLLLDFLADRRLWGFRRALEVEIKLGRTDFDRTELDMTLKRYLQLLEEFGERTVEPTRPKPQPVPAPEKPLPEDNGWDLNEVLAQEPFALTTEIETEKPEEKQKTMRIVRKEPEVEPAIQLTQSSTTLRSLIDEKTEKGFVKKLFGGDSAAFEEIMDKLDSADSWRSAKVLIDNELYKRDVDPFSREAIKLVDMVYSRYYPEEGVGGKA